VLFVTKQTSGFTHASVDALLCKLVELSIPFVRLAPSPKAVHESVRPFVVAQTARTVSELRSLLEAPLVVGATCLQIKHQLFSKRRFDVCIVDEATQITVSAVLGPLRCASRFVLVGDHYQLPPFVKSAEAKEMGMGQSLFYTLSKEHPRAVSMLEYQYRVKRRKRVSLFRFLTFFRFER
jgi:DNA replication ATP-dependent helicase Dna2